MTDYHQKYLKEVEENNFLKEDIQLLRQKIDELIDEKVSIHEELTQLREDFIQIKTLNENGFKAVQEFLSFLDKDNLYTYNAHKYNDRYYYKIYNKKGICIFILENYRRGYSIHPGLIITLEMKDINNDYKQIYNSVTSSWYQFADYKGRKQYDICGKKISDVMNILNKFH